MPSYKFRILLDTDTSEEIFRDIVISSNENFEILYRAILTAFEFTGQELASFYVSNDHWDKGHEIALMDMELNETLNAPSIMQETIIADMVTGRGQKFILVYDFLRMWCFLIELVETLPQHYDNPQLELSVGTAPDETSRKIDLSADISSTGLADLGNDFDDIFNDSDEDMDDEFGDFENYEDSDY